jgi:hypothetical protein
MTMTKTFLPSLALLTILLGCGRDPSHESGQPDDRPEPKTADEAMAQQADKQERQKALREKGLCTPAAIREAPEPDERFWHCRGEDWTGSTDIKDALADLPTDPLARKAECDELLADLLGVKRALCEGFKP